MVENDEIVVGVIAVPTEAAQQVADELVAGRREDHLQLLRGPAAGAAGGHGAHVEPGGGPALRAVLLPHLTLLPMLDMKLAREAFEASQDFTVGIEEEFGILDPDTLELDHRYEELREAAQADDVLADSVAGELIASEIEIRSGRGEHLADALAAPARGPRPAVRLGGRSQRAAVLHGHPPLEPLAGPAHHRHRALPPAGARPGLRGSAQQHLQPARARGDQGRRPGRRRVRPPASRSCPSCWR